MGRKSRTLPIPLSQTCPEVTGLIRLLYCMLVSPDRGGWEAKNNDSLLSQSKSINLIRMTFSHMAIEICSSHLSSSSSRAAETHFAHICPTSQPGFSSYKRTDEKISTLDGGRTTDIRKQKPTNIEFIFCPPMQAHAHQRPRSTTRTFPKGERNS